MKISCIRLFLLTGLLFTYHYLFSQNIPASIKINGLQNGVEIIVDHWGVPHIFAAHEKDLFFAQGFNAARDRLFQLEIWRRQATGTIAEILGPRELKRDIGARLFMFRGDMEQEMKHYHERGDVIIKSFVDGVNAYIDHVLKNPGQLPIEFELLGILPRKWTPEIVVSRHQGLLGNIGRELDIARLVSLAGEETAKDLYWFHPRDPDLSIHPSIDSGHLFKDILELYDAFRNTVRFLPEDLIASARNPKSNDYRDFTGLEVPPDEYKSEDIYLDMGSNNWVVNGDHTQSGFPIMANDPHRRQSVPSLRYMAHLHAPGWNVVGGGEPEIPGISIGHNNYGAWGLTVFQTDGEDLYVYRLNPDNPLQYWYKGAWESMRVISDTIPVKNSDAAIVDLKYTRHGPVCYVDEEAGIAYAIRCAWLEVGGSPYLASLRMNQSRDFKEFREACKYSHIPGENMVWADREGNIGFQAVGIAPIRRNWSGMVPVPGDGTYEWEEYLPITAKPHLYNPSGGMIYTANANVTPGDYPYWDAIGYNWSDPYREDRIAELLKSGRKHSLKDMAAYQTDYLSIPARQIVPFTEHLQSEDPDVQKAIRMLTEWDFVLRPESAAAAIYNEWERMIRTQVTGLVTDPETRNHVSIQMKRVLDWLLLPDGRFGEDPLKGRDQLLLNALTEAVGNLRVKLGEDMGNWKYGQPDYKHITIKHPLGEAVNDSLRRLLNVGPTPRGGNSFTLNSTSSSNNQSSGASFRMIVDTENWDLCLGSNSPGQSGNPAHPHYNNLFDLWAEDRYFPVFFTRGKIESVKSYTLYLEPADE